MYSLLFLAKINELKSTGNSKSHEVLTFKLVDTIVCDFGELCQIQMFQTENEREIFGLHVNE